MSSKKFLKTLDKYEAIKDMVERAVHPILKKKLHKNPDMSTLGVALSSLGAGQKHAVIRGMALAKSLGFDVQKGALTETVPGMSLNIYNGDDKIGLSKASHKRHVKFAEKMMVRENGVDTEENTLFEREHVYQCHLAFIFEPMFDISMKEIQLLK